MTTNSLMTKLTIAVALVTVSTATSVRAATYDLHAAAFEQTMADGSLIEMWGYGLVGQAVSVPGPLLVVPPGDTSLAVNLTNELAVPISLIIPGQLGALTPVWNDGSSGARPSLAARARSFQAETAAGATRTYQWTGLRAGTYLYHSGTHPQVQVQMGLYGAAKVDAGLGLAYDGITYDNEVVLLVSEVDPALHTAVADGSYGTASYPSTLNYAAKHFLINGESFPSAQPLFPAATPSGILVGQRVLVRMLNAGLMTHTLALSGGYWSLVAEDGFKAPYAREQYSTMLGAGTTADAIFTPLVADDFVVYDRSLSLTNGMQAGGGLMTTLSVFAPADVPVAMMDGYDVLEDTLLDTALQGLPSVLANDSGAGLSASVVVGPTAGTLALAADGYFTYQPFANFVGMDHFTYQASDGVLTSAPAQVHLMVMAVNDAPVAAADSVEATAGQLLVVAAPGVLANDSDVEGDALTAVLTVPTLGGLLTLAADGSFTYLPDLGTVADSFSYVASDGLATSAEVVVSILVLTPVNVAPTALDDTFALPKNTTGIFNLIANDLDPDGALNPASIVVTSGPTRGGVLVVVGDGTVRYTPPRNFRGTDTFTYTVADAAGAVSNAATVRVNVTK